MTPLELYLLENIPLTYHATFTVIKDGETAAIIGGIAACDACDQVVAMVDGLNCDHRTLEMLVSRFNCEQPPIAELEERIALELGEKYDRRYCNA